MKPSTESQPAMPGGSFSFEEAIFPISATPAEVLQIPAPNEVDPTVVSNRAAHVGTNIIQLRDAAARGDFSYAT